MHRTHALECWYLFENWEMAIKLHIPGMVFIYQKLCYALTSNHFCWAQLSFQKGNKKKLKLIQFRKSKNEKKSTIEALQTFQNISAMNAEQTRCHSTELTGVYFLCRRLCVHVWLKLVSLGWYRSGEPTHTEEIECKIIDEWRKCAL